jgi:hypothetical protein
MSEDQDIYDRIVATDQDFGCPLLVDPKAGTVTIDFNRSITEENLHMDVDSDGVQAGKFWDAIWEKFEYDIRAYFEPAEFMTAGTWHYWLHEYVDAGTPFVLQTFVIDGFGPDHTEGDEPIGVGWGFAIKLIDQEG